MYLLFPRQGDKNLQNHPPNKPSDGATNGQITGGGGSGEHHKGMSAVGIAMLVLFILLLVGGVLYVSYVVLRARRLGLPTPSWRSYVPFMNSTSRGRPSTGPLGWIKSKIPNSGGGGGNFMGGGSTGYTGAAERSRRTHAQFGQLRQDDDEAWDARGYRGVYDNEGQDDNELQQRGRPIPSSHGTAAATGYGGGGLRAVSEEDGEPRRGRSRSREPAPAQNMPQKFPGVVPPPRPFSGDSFTGVSVKGGRASLDGERRSVFREAM